MCFGVIRVEVGVDMMFIRELKRCRKGFYVFEEVVLKRLITV